MDLPANLGQCDTALDRTVLLSLILPPARQLSDLMLLISGCQRDGDGVSGNDSETTEI